MPQPYESWITVEAVREALAADLGCPPEELPQSWSTVIPRAMETAYYECRDALTSRGYSPAQMDVWDRRTELVREQAVYWALVLRAQLTGMDPRQFEPRNRLKAIQVLTVTVGGVPTFPAAGADGAGGLSVAGGRLSEVGYRFDSTTDF